MPVIPVTKKGQFRRVFECGPAYRTIGGPHWGATSGIGAETARVLAKRGARIVIPVRNLKAAVEVKARI
ncbi:Short-chain dehydrogenase TIC 32, chloroplastic, partial [Cucurbita argyrosperma subsp. argyrosperma]